MRILVVTSCTGEKAVDHPRQLTMSDFRRGPTHVSQREKELEASLLPAEQLYTGQQHVRLMRGIDRHRHSLQIDLWVLSAGYGLVPGDRKIAPYEATFAGMGKVELRRWADQLGVPGAIRQVLTKPFDLALILLGDSYLQACAFDGAVKLAGQTILFAGTGALRTLPRLGGLRTIPLSNQEAKRFSCGLVSLKGELGARFLDRLITDETFLKRVREPSEDVLAALTNSKVDYVISLPQSWKDKPHRHRLRYFIPEWDDLVDPDYDFQTDTHSSGSGDWSNEVYAHQLYPAPSYDGILVSRAVAQKSKKKDARINQLGVHRFLRVPRDFPIMGDCGAFDYIDLKEPPYATEDVIDYYTRLGFDAGVSVDHLIVPAFHGDKEFRYQLTIHNAEEFLKEHQKRGLAWEPIGAVQGWDASSYADAATAYTKMGYRYLALGGLVRCQTPEILATIKAVRTVIPAATGLHLFGFSRFDAIYDIARLGVNSIDSASVLRKAWLGQKLNYLTSDGWYSAIRIPQSDKSFRAKRLKSNAIVTPKRLHILERSCLMGVRSHAQGGGQASESLIRLLHEYDALVAGDRPGIDEAIRRTLDERPWERCGCAICRRWGIEIVVFRGNNRNRRRGFHNTKVFYDMLADLVRGKRIPWLKTNQLELSIEEKAVA